MEVQSPSVQFLPGNAAIADGKKAIAVLLDADHDDAVTQEGDARAAGEPGA